MGIKYQVLAIMGKSASGKDSIVKETIHRHPGLFNPVVSCTTRPPRDYEENGKDYYFLSLEDFTRKVLNGDMLEATEFNGWFYGTTIDSLSTSRINLCVLNPAGVEALIEDPRLEVEVIYVYCDDKTRLMRSLGREKDPNCAEICRRFLADQKDFAAAEKNIAYYTLDNCGETRKECLDLCYAGNELQVLIDSMIRRIERDSAKINKE